MAKKVATKKPPVAMPDIQDERGAKVIVTPVDTRVDPLLKKDRATCKILYYHEHKGEEPSMVDLTYTGPIQTFGLEPLVKKRLRLDENWSVLPYGELVPADVGRIVIQNLCGTNLDVMPTDEEKAQFAKQVFRVREAGVKHGLELLIPSGEFQIFYVSKKNLEIRCECGEGRGYVWVYPR